MAGSENFYPGTNYGLDPNYGDSFLGIQYRVPASQFSLTTDPRSANQLAEVSKKLSTGAKGVEVTGISTQILESVPEQHLTEINRLKKLTGANLTFHGPLVEPTGINPEAGFWSEDMREQAERQILSAVKRSHKLDPQGNIIVTLHSSNGLPEPDTKIKDENGKEKSTYLTIMNERTGRFQRLPPPRNDYWMGEPKEAKAELRKMNEENWTNELGTLNFIVHRGRNALSDSVRRLSSYEGGPELKQADVIKLHTIANTPEGEKTLKALPPEAQAIAKNVIQEVDFGKTEIKEAYTKFKEMYNQAYTAVENKEDKKKLESYQTEVAKKLENWKDDKDKLLDLADEVSRGIRLLNSIKAPQMFKPIRDFAVEKSGQTFGNVAFEGYKEFGNTAPIISIENPPAGMGLSRADDLRDIVKTARDNFAKKAEKELGLSASEAEAQAKKLIGVTWDVGHINMIRKYGYDESDVVGEAKKIAPFVKHVHLSDNFGLDHTELPMGMGNVPIKKIMELNENFQKAKKVIETGGPWYQFFQKSPLRETLQAFGSPVYGMEAVYWNQIAASSGGYSAGFGRILPDVNFNTYGAGFATLPTELGGQLPGTQNRFSGTPMQ